MEADFLGGGFKSTFRNILRVSVMYQIAVDRPTRNQIPDVKGAFYITFYRTIQLKWKTTT